MESIAIDLSRQDPVQRVIGAGRFVRTSEGGPYYLPNPDGAPIPVVTEKFAAVVGEMLDMNATDDGFPAVLKQLRRHAELHSESRRHGTLAEKVEEKDVVIVNTGNGRTLAVYPDKVRILPTGRGGLLMTDEPGFEAVDAKAIVTAMEEESASDRREFRTFRRVIADRLPPVSGDLIQKEAIALIIAAVLSVFLRWAARGRPILLFHAPPRGGKTLVARQIGVAIVGPSFDVSGRTTGDRAIKDLIAAAVHRSFCVRDEMNDVPAQILDVLCGLATGTKFDVSSFYETMAICSYQSRASLIMTSWRPTWLSRWDLLSRIMPVHFALPPPSMMTEEERTDAVAAVRPAIWAEIISGLQLILRGVPERLPITRFAAWEKHVYPVLAAAGLGDAFESALRKMPLIRLRLATANDPLLAVLHQFARRNPDLWIPAAQLTDSLAIMMGTQRAEHDPHEASQIVRNPLSLSKFLAHIQAKGSAVIEIRSKPGPGHSRLWNLRPLDLA